MRLKKALIEFLSDELHLTADTLSEETSFAELGVSPEKLPDLLHRLQDALGLVLPEDRLAQVTTLSDLLDVVDENETDY